MTKNIRRCSIQWDNNTFLTSTQLRADQSDFLFNQFHFWTSNPNKRSHSDDRHFFHEVINPKLFSRELSSRTAAKLNQEVRILIATDYPQASTSKSVLVVENMCRTLQNSAFYYLVLSCRKDL